MLTVSTSVPKMLAFGPNWIVTSESFGMAPKTFLQAGSEWASVLEWVPFSEVAEAFAKLKVRV